MTQLPTTTTEEALEAYATVFGPAWAEGLGKHMPERLIPGVVRYVAYGTKPGDFLCSYLQNDLMAALGRADDQNRNRLWDIGMALHNYAPSGCFGSVENFENWLMMKGFVGKDGA